MKTCNTSRISRRQCLEVALAAGSALLPAAATIADPLKKIGGSSANRVLGRGGIHHVGIRTRDWERTIAFYEKALGFTLKLGWGIAPRCGAFLDSGDGSCVEVGEDLSWVPPPPSDLPPLKVPNGPIASMSLSTSRLDAACENARTCGARVLIAPREDTLNVTTGEGPVRVRFAYLEGPSREWVQLLETTE